MKIENIEISGVGGIDNIDISFSPGFNFICGPNGVGKTTILECVAHSFTSSSTEILKRNVRHERGSFSSVIENDGSRETINSNVLDFEPGSQTRIMGRHQLSRKLLSLKVTRTFSYQALSAVARDTDKADGVIHNEVKNGVNIHEVKNWFVNRFLYSGHVGALSDIQIDNLNLAKECFSVLNPDFRFRTVSAASNEIMIDTPSGEIYYEYLSSGFKSSLSIIFGIIKDIEYRFKDPGLRARDFDGIILIDELELHLHPEWQARISVILKEIFPYAQFITTTHSPHVLQNAEPMEIIALGFDNDRVVRRDLTQCEYGFKGWTVEEVLEDVMGMEDTRTPIYQEYMKVFEDAVADDDVEKASDAYEQLDKLLHPENHLRKLLKFDMATLSKGESE